MSLRDYPEGQKRKKIGPRVIPQLWEDFKAYAENKNGKQGMASEELQKAMIEYMEPEGEEGESNGDVAKKLEILDTKMDLLLVQENQ